MPTPTHLARTPTYRIGGAMLFLMLAVIVAALGFQYIGGIQPCELCLQQRWAYYFGIPLTFVALALFAGGHPRAAGLILVHVAFLFLANAGLGIYHAGVEWKFWPGPETCSGALAPIGQGSGGILSQLGQTRVVRCDAAAWTFLGLSLAGWNVIASFLLCWGLLQAALSAPTRP